MHPKTILAGLVTSLVAGLLCLPALSSAADSPAGGSTSSPSSVSTSSASSGVAAPAAASASPAALAKVAAGVQNSAARAALPQGVEWGVLTILPPTEEIVVSFPLLLVERGTVENLDAGAGIVELKRKDGSLAKIRVSDTTIVENVYADIFTWESKKGIHDLKKGDRVRARVWPAHNDVENALLIDVFHL